MARSDRIGASGCTRDALVLFSGVGAGTAGYRLVGDLDWIDAFLNASMILSGMGPVDRMETTAGKLFAAFYRSSADWCSSP